MEMEELLGEIQALRTELNELKENFDEAADELDALLAQQDLKTNNGGSWGEEDVKELFGAMGKLARASRELHEKRLEIPGFKERMEAFGKDEDIFEKVADAAKRYNLENNYVAGANIAGFEKVVDAMKAQGLV